MEQPRRVRRIALIAAAALAFTVLGFRVLRSGDRVETVPAEARIPRLVKDDVRVTAEVLNGTDRRGLARLVTRLLRQGGVDVVYFGTADDPGADRTEILVRRGDDTAVADRIAKALGAGTVRVAPAPRRRVDLTVVIGRDYVAPATAHP